MTVWRVGSDGVWGGADDGEVWYYSRMVCSETALGASTLVAPHQSMFKVRFHKQFRQLSLANDTFGHSW